MTVSEGARNSDGACGGVYKFTLEPGSRGKVRSYLFSPAGTGCNPAAGVFLDKSSGAIYGTTKTGGNIGGGNVYKITGKKGIVLYNFCSQPSCADGLEPSGSLTVRGGGAYSTTLLGGAFNQGVVFEIKP